MAVKVRMRRTGSNKDICYRVVVTDERSPRDGKFLENVGWYDPKIEGINFKIDMDRIEYWRAHGAIVSDPVKSLMRMQRRQAKATA